jgi:UPF0755 protein
MEIPEEKKIEVATQDNTESILEEEKRGKFGALFAALGTESRSSKIFLGGVLFFVFAVAIGTFYFLPPGKVISIKNGSLTGDIAVLFENEHLIRSQNVFKICVAISGGDKKVGGGDYLFKEPLGTCALALRLIKGISGIPAFRVTIPEGTSNQQIASLLSPGLLKFDPKFFIDHARGNEGYLFPDTYFFATNATAQVVETTMRANFDKKIARWQPIIESSKHSLRDTIIMASILEKEARTPEDQALVSGILWKRIDNKIPLQVDATFLYLLGKKSSELTQADLQIKSAYNTYRNRGLPAGPIGNPGLLAVEAAVRPTDSPYLYYLSDKNGVIHYAKTFEEHKANKAKYLY